MFLWFVLNRHRFGEHLLFIGDSNEVARVVGIDVVREKIKLFTLMGVLAALAAIFLTLENKNFFDNQGQGYLLTAIASVFIGGTSIFGGQATIVGTVFGCCIIGMIEAGLVATGSRRLGAHRAGSRVPDRGGVLSSGRGAAAAGDPAALDLRRGVTNQGRIERHAQTMLLRAQAAAVGYLAAGTAIAADRARQGHHHLHADGRQPGRRRHLPRQTGAAAAAKAFGVDQLNEQFSGWAPEKMIDQFREALAAKPACIVIMGHPGNEAFTDLVKQAFDQGIVVTHGNAPLTEMQTDVSAPRASAMPASTSTRAARSRPSG